VRGPAENPAVENAFIHAPGQPPFRITPGAKILEVKITDRENFRCAGQFWTVLHPKLRPAIISGAKEEKRIGAHLPVLVPKIRLNDRDAPPQPCFKPARCLDDVHKEQIAEAVSICTEKKGRETPQYLDESLFFKLKLFV